MNKEDKDIIVANLTKYLYILYVYSYFPKGQQQMNFASLKDIFEAEAEKNEELRELMNKLKELEKEPPQDEPNDD